MSVNIQFCCGTNHLAGWHNYDQEVDIAKPLPFPNDRADYVFIEHGLEHVSGPSGLRFLDECHRILKPGGRLRICVPVLDRLPDAHARDIVLNHGHRVVFDEGVLCRLLSLAGFKNVQSVPLDKNLDGHWRVIGEEKDVRETLRVEVIK